MEPTRRWREDQLHKAALWPMQAVAAPLSSISSYRHTNNKVKSKIIIQWFSVTKPHYHHTVKFQAISSAPGKTLCREQFFSSPPLPQLLKPWISFQFLEIRLLGAFHVNETILHVWNHTTHGPLCTASLHTAMFSMFIQVLACVWASLLNGLRLHGYTTFCIFTWQLMNIWVALPYSCKGQSLVCSFLGEQVFHLFGKHQISGLTFFLLLKVDFSPQTIYPLCITPSSSPAPLSSTHTLPVSH